MSRFEKTYCSQCGSTFGPGDQGYSHCEDHTPKPEWNGECVLGHCGSPSGCERDNCCRADPSFGMQVAAPAPSAPADQPSPAPTEEPRTDLPPVHIDVERMRRALAGPRILIPQGLSAEEVIAFINAHAASATEEPIAPGDAGVGGNDDR